MCECLKKNLQEYRDFKVKQTESNASIITLNVQSLDQWFSTILVP